MAKSNKVATAVAKSVNPALAADILAQAGAVAAKAIDVQISTSVSTESFQSDFAALCLAAGVPVIKRDGVERFDRESEVGKALHAVLKVKATESAKGRAHYSVEVHKVGDDDNYLPVRMWSRLAKKWSPIDIEGNVVDPATVSPDMKTASHGVTLRQANHTFTAAFALGVDLKSLASVAEKPNGVKAWMRGTAVGERPDAKGQGMRDWINNDVDQALSRGWKTDASGRAGGAKQDFADLLNGLHKAGTKKRARFAKDNSDESVVSEAQWSALCALVQTLAFDPDLFDAVYQAADDLAATKS